MTKREMVETMMRGEVLEFNDGNIGFYDPEHQSGPFVYKRKDGSTEPINGAWSSYCKIKPKKQKRTCTPLEVLAITTKPNRVVRDIGLPEYYPSQYYAGQINFTNQFVWAEFDENGNLGPEHEFMVEE